MIVKKGHYYKVKTPANSLVIAKCVSETAYSQFNSNENVYEFKVIHIIHKAVDTPFRGSYAWRESRIMYEIEEENLVLELLE